MNLRTQESQLLPVPRSRLRACGLTALLATPEPNAEQLGPILDELAHDSCVHSWQGHLALAQDKDVAHRVQALLDADRAQRPTTVFAYLGITPTNEVIPVGVAAVAERIRSDFPFEGFPVIARAYICHAYRGRGLYPSLVRHRLDYCVQEWGDRLRGVHLGSADPAVWQTAARGPFFSAPFLFIGTEDLRVGDKVHRVKDFLSMTPSFLGDLNEGLDKVLDGFSSHSEALEATALLKRFVREGDEGVSYGDLFAALEKSAGAGRDLRKASQAIRELLAFCDAIPLTR